MTEDRSRCSYRYTPYLLKGRKMSIAEENKKIVERCTIATYNDGNVESIDELVHDDFVLHDPESSKEIRGRDGLKEHVETYRSAFPDFDCTVESIIAEDDLVAVRFTVRGTHEGALPELPDREPTGREIEVAGMEFDRLEDGKLVECWLVYDSLGLMQQLGAASLETAEEPPAVAPN